MFGVEVKKLFDYIIKNKKFDLNDPDSINRITLIDLWEGIKGNKDKDVKLSKKQQKKIIDSYLLSNEVIGPNTPEIIKKNKECIIKSIQLDLNSINYIVDKKWYLKKDECYNEDFGNIYYVPEYAVEEFFKQLENKSYVLSKKSPDFLRFDLKVALKSIEEDIDSANFILLDYMSSKEQKEIISRMIELGYELSEKSSSNIKANIDIVLDAISKDISNAKYAEGEAKRDPRVLKILIENDFDLSIEDIKDFNLSLCTDKTMMRGVLKALYDYLDVFDDQMKEKDYLNKMAEVYWGALNKDLTIEKIKQSFDYFAEEAWMHHRLNFMELYANVFGKICATLCKYDNFEKALDEINCLGEMEEVLGDKYNTVFKTMSLYHKLAHSGEKDEAFNKCRNQLAKLSGLYVAKAKENYKKDIVDGILDNMKGHFKLDKNNSLVISKARENCQKDRFSYLYRHNDEEINKFISRITEKYKDEVPEILLNDMVYHFVVCDESKLDKFYKAPKGFTDYKKYKEACKLINRLNSGFIKYTDLELSNYRDIIVLDEETNKYYYNGRTFTQENIDRYIVYKKYQVIFEKIKQEIMAKVKTLETTEEEINEIIEERSFRRKFNFTDEFFKFDREDVLDSYTIKDFINRCTFEGHATDFNDELDDDTYKLLKEFGINSSIIWFNLFEAYNWCDYYDHDEYYEAMNSMELLSTLSDVVPSDFSNIGDVLNLVKLSESADEASIAALGTDVIFNICRNRDHTYHSSEQIVDRAYDLVSRMVLRTDSTVPYVHGETENYRYSLYDVLDNNVLLAGINTDACFKVDGVDNDFLHYCLLDKNGFVIKIEDKNGNFIGRAGGFRNGNCVFINQLRTIYDRGGSGYLGNVESEQLEIVDAFQQACRDMVNISQNNPMEKDKIDHVFVTQSYAFEEFDSNVSEDVREAIGNAPMVNNSRDWAMFCEETDNLRDCDIEDGFTTDYGNYDLICVASKRSNIHPKNIKKKDVRSVYMRPRNNISIKTNPDEDFIRKMEKTNSIAFRNSWKLYEPLSISKDCIYFQGDNWYIIYNTKTKETEMNCLQEPFAIKEAKATLEVIKETLNAKRRPTVDSYTKRIVNKLPKNYCMKSPTK